MAEKKNGQHGELMDYGGEHVVALQEEESALPKRSMDEIKEKEINKTEVMVDEQVQPRKSARCICIIILSIL